ncbi:Zinc finger protein CONSTANS [Quillaja saponaria]|uniref:Zinc finger protein CONSTANS n=1 Tax=Quillaja saponaria TaxID=32244 RepID=A0AAD7LJJ5_QUISA|nr:Zinc finger protein CONSTANS [Quillaja saponaria]
MYAETGILFPYLQNFSQELQQLEEYCKTQKSNASMNDLAQASTISYDLGGEGDLFKAPEPIIEEPVMVLDPMTAAMSMLSSGEDAISPQGLKATEMDSLQNEQLFSEVFYECKRDLLEKASLQSPLSEILDIKVPVLGIEVNQIQEDKPLPDSPFQKSVSSGCLDFPGMDFSAAYRIRRAFSEGDIENLDNGSVIQSQQPLIIINCNNEDRQEKLSRYRNKKAKRNFGRKIKEGSC